MKATLSIVDENGNRYHGTAELSLTDDPQEKTEEVPNQKASAIQNIEFGLPIRAFVKKYAAGNSGGAAKLTVLLAFLAKGKSNTEIPAETVRTEWNRLTAHLGAFNRAHSTRAKDRAWVDSPAQGTYRLGPLWREAF
jgi:hypothetical protein